MPDYKLALIAVVAIAFFAAVPTPTRACGCVRVPSVPEQDSEKVWKQVRDRQKKMKRHAIFIEYALDIRGHRALMTALRAESQEMQELLGVFELVCLERRQLLKHFADMRLDDNCILVDPEGKMVAGTYLDLPKLGTPKLLNQAITGFMSKADGFRMAKWADQSKKGLAEDKLREIQDALRDLDAEGYRERREARKVVSAQLPRIAPLVFHLRCTTKSVEMKASCSRLLAEASPRVAAAILGLPCNDDEDDDEDDDDDVWD